MNSSVVVLASIVMLPVLYFCLHLLLRAQAMLFSSVVKLDLHFLNASSQVLLLLKWFPNDFN